MYHNWLSGPGYFTQNFFFLFCKWLASFQMSFFFDSQVILHCVNVLHFLYPIFNQGVSGYFQYLALMNKASMFVLICFQFWCLVCVNMFLVLVLTETRRQNLKFLQARVTDNCNQPKMILEDKLLCSEKQISSLKFSAIFVNSVYYNLVILIWKYILFLLGKNYVQSHDLLWHVSLKDCFIERIQHVTHLFS